MSWARRLRSLFRRDELDSEIDAELAFHVAERMDELVGEGVSQVEARRQALIQFGGYARRKEEIREIDMLSKLDAVIRDVRYGLRTLRGSPAFTATAILSLTLGIGANTAIFSIINALMLRSLPVADPARLVEVRSQEIGPEFTNPIWQQLRDRQQAFSGMLAWSTDKFNLSQGGESRFARGIWVSGDFFRVLGVPALEGRVFTAQENRRGTAPVAVISYAFWKRNYPDDASAIGKIIHLNRHAFEVVGVTPPWFTGLDVASSYDVAIPIACDPILHTDLSFLDNRSVWWLQILGRLAPGETMAQAQAQLNAYAPAILKATVAPDWRVDEQKEFLKASFTLNPAATGFSEVRTYYKTGLLTLMGTALLVLLITCANIATLLLARAWVRQRELAVRLALGASRTRVVFQLLIESLLLSAAGTAAGFALALWGSKLLVRLISTAGNPVTVDLSPDFHLMGFLAAAAIVTAVLFGLAPAFRATRGDLNHALKENARGTVLGATRFHLGKALVTGQIALSLMLLVAAGLFLGTLNNLLSTDLGFNPHGVLLVNAQFQENAVAKERRAGITAEIVSHLRAIPGVLSAASSLRTPISNYGWNELAQPEGYRAKSRMDTLMWFNRVSPQYFSTMGTRLQMGRDFTEADNLGASKVMVISQGTARHFFGFANPLGKRIGIGSPGNDNKEDFYQVVGVVDNSKYQRIDEGERLTGFFASGQDSDPQARINFEVRYAGPADASVRAVRSAILAINPNVSLEFQNLETQVNESVMQPRVVALLSGIFALLALALSAVGLYGVTAYGMSRRRNEIGIRIALGAKRNSVIWLALRDIGTLLAIGLALGLCGSMALGRLVKSLLYGVQANDPRQLAAAALILALCAFIAAYLPARRAAGLDPLDALREE